MRRTTFLVLGAALLALAVLAGLPAGAQQPQQTYTLDWWTVDGGGGTFSTGGGYSLGGTAGQPDAGVLAGGGYTLGGGFWRGGAAAAQHRIFLPLIVRGG
jgi:hypothetical protein